MAVATHGKRDVFEDSLSENNGMQFCNYIFYNDTVKCKNTSDK